MTKCINAINPKPWMQRFSFLLALGLLGLPAHSRYNETKLLPENFKVYVNNENLINHRAPGFTATVLPTRNLYKGAEGGYIACYSRVQARSAYGIGGGMYVMGQVRMPGHYKGRIFYPEGYEDKDISAATALKQVCNITFSACQGGCWAGGDTGGWLGIP